MRKNQHRGLLISTLAVVNIGLLLLITLVFVTSNKNAGSKVSDAESNNLAQAGASVSTPLTSNMANTSISTPSFSASAPTSIVGNLATLSPTPPSSIILPATKINVLFPSLVDGQVIQLPFLAVGPNLVLKKTSNPPLIGVDDAILAIKERGVDWALDGIYNGTPVEITLVQGLATFGQVGDTSNISLPDGTHPQGSCAGWLGPCNVPVKRCANGTCTDTGKVIGRLENRSSWIVDYKVNTSIAAAGGATSAPKVDPLKIHIVHVVDHAEKTLLMVWPYNEP